MELEFVDFLKNALPPHPQLRLGVGDDAAVLRLAERADCVVTSDLLAEGTHFTRSEATPEQIGRKALAVNLSDLAAMAARPLAATVSLLLPRREAAPLARSLLAGMLPLAAEFNVAIAGGDTNCWDGPLVVAVTALGESTTECKFRRDAARSGDAVVVSGELGGSRAGKQFDFRPRVNEALRLAAEFDVHAAMDVSDGLLLDLSRICAASRCGAELNLASVPVAAAARAPVAVRSSSLGEGSLAQLEPHLARALTDGEDFELLLTMPAEEAARLTRDNTFDLRWTVIGRIAAESGLRGVDASDKSIPLAPIGFEHGADKS
ncbi:MAG: thiamine-phosphate kinase [Planctomycetales bacterium]|nr:thiamine-phosphate kinase [Planctomycetales bacterium]